MMDIVVADMHYDNSNMAYLFNIFMFFNGNNVIESNYINSISIFTAIVTILNNFLKIFVMLATQFIECMVSFNNNGRSYYKFIYWSRFLFNPLPMIIIWINPAESMTCIMMEVVKSNLTQINNTRCQKNNHNGRKNHSHDNTYCAVMDCSSTWMIDVVCIIFSIYTVMDHIFSIFLDIYTLYIDDTIITTIYIRFESIFISFRKIYFQLLNFFINCGVMMMEFNSGYHKSYFEFILDYCLFNYSIVVYLAIISLKSTMYDIIQWIQQDFNMNDNFGRYKLENDEPCQFDANMHCVSINCILIRIMNVIGAIYFVYVFINDFFISTSNSIMLLYANYHIFNNYNITFLLQSKNGISSVR